ncbi:hypothetical protein [Flavobacterium columnare]|uniref:Uncharacterized protein n=1 Tax=Flavobacterium columnare (strain ATCC 49512 / CIP 103533 / TG 44/87) TaxID=1041826 RepID=G8X9F4_FLACA|nr:hypothetical protein [Flavobacterium columnare]AEW85901.1 hypothetical protein FCOL_05380 [Flavobacterium columnare ATCC 49512]
MQKESNNTVHIPTLQQIEREVFFANSVSEVSHDLDRGLVCFMNSIDADDLENRMSFLTSYWAIKRTLAVIQLKQNPEQCDDITCSFLL